MTAATHRPPGDREREETREWMREGETQQDQGGAGERYKRERHKRERHNNSSDTPTTFARYGGKGSEGGHKRERKVGGQRATGIRRDTTRRDVGGEYGEGDRRETERETGYVVEREE